MGAALRAKHPGFSTDFVENGADEAHDFVVAKDEFQAFHNHSANFLHDANYELKVRHHDKGKANGRSHCGKMRVAAVSDW